jgi:hypothetical protein
MFVITFITVILIVGIVMEQIHVVTQTITITDVVKVIKLQQPNIHIPLLQQQLDLLTFVITRIGCGHVMVLVVFFLITTPNVV